MNEAGDDALDYGSLVREGAVHSSVFTRESVYEDELQRIFYRFWVFLAHESEIPEPGSYCTKWVGRQPIIVCRGADGEIRAFFNRCRHRGTAVCSSDRGTTDFFRCPYHGWTYNNRGKLVGVPYPSRYGPEFERETLGLTPVPRLDAHRGFLFASLADTGPTLAEHLGRAAACIDAFVDASPTGKVRLDAGASKAAFHGNWKFVGMDGYHVNFTHKTALDLQQRKKGAEYARGADNTDKSPNESLDLGQGHCRLDLTVNDEVEVGKASSSFIAGELPDTDAGRAYFEAMVERYGTAEGAKEAIHAARDVHVHIWPNLQLIGSQVRVIRPLSAASTEVIGYPAMLADVPVEMNERRLRAYEWFNGVAGFGGPDDSEVFERNQLGLVAEREPWIVLMRGAGMEQDRSGVVVGNITDEVPQRAQMRQWLTAMQS